MTIKLIIWKSTDTGQVRVYVDARYAGESALIDADRGYFSRDPDGKIAVHFHPSMDGRFGHGMRRLMEHAGIKREEDFDTFVRDVKAAKGPRGATFNMDVFIRNRTISV